MRTASRVFFWIGLFGLFADVVYSSASRFQRENLQGIVILTAFTGACLLLARMLGRQADVDGLTLPSAHDAHEDEEIHLPGPSWYPAFYGVTLFMVVMGLVFGTGLLIAGVVLTVLVTIGWARESVKDYRREIAHAEAPVDLPDQQTIELAHQVLTFRRAHGGADAVVQHLGRGSAEIVLVGSDGAWGNLVGGDVEQAREACALADVTLHQTWPSGLGARVRTGENDWRAMGGERPLSSVEHHAPRDGTTQVAAKVFLALAIFGLLATLTFATASKFSYDNLQGIVILTAFSVACYYLYLGLKNAKARPEDVAYAGDDHVTVEPSIPDPPVDLETLHLPGPSWWPAFFSIALFALVLGLVYSTGLLIAGVVLTVACCVGWGIESVHEYRQSISGQHHGAADALHNDPAPLAH